MTNTTDEIIARIGNLAGEMEGELSAAGKLEWAEPKRERIDEDLAELRARFATLEAETREAAERLKQSEASTVKAMALDKFADHCRARNEGLADSERMDWLEKQMKGARQWPTYDPVSMDPQCEFAFFAVEDDGKHGLVPYDTLRAAIDATLFDGGAR